MSAASVRAEILDRIVAVVGEEPVLLSDVTGLRRELLASPALANIYRLNASAVTEDQILSLLIDERIVKQALKELDMTVPESEVDAQIESIAKQNRIGVRQLEDSLKREGIRFESYRANIRAQIERRNIFDRELRRGGGISEQDLRAVYDQNAQPELNLTVIEGPKDRIAALATKKLKKEDVAALGEPFSTDELGWVDSSGLSEKIAKAARQAQTGDLLGPVPSGRRQRLFFVTAVRKGSEEEFQRVKNELMSQAQAQDYDRRFKFWVEGKKKEMTIVLNK